ncbi:protein kinase family protein [Pseudonocardia phyllosphaerae]|uniref:protein kinase family protein n=1 Tax=Pseudonocardia phyllosphaerae TaxID=3390502 RepID=UPI00397DA054
MNGQTDQRAARVDGRPDDSGEARPIHPGDDDGGPATLEQPAVDRPDGAAPAPRAHTTNRKPSPHKRDQDGRDQSPRDAGSREQAPREQGAGDQGGRTAAVPAQARSTDRIPAARDAVGTTAGSQVTDRYVLRQRIGSDPAAGAEFWRAEDTVLRRPVGITLLRRLPADDRSDDPEGAARAGEMVVRALRSGCFEHPGSARLLDVLAPGTHGLPEDVLGASVAEWVPGRSLAEAVAEGPVRAQRAAKAVETLASAATEAHQQGLVLGCDHPQRIRITPDGRAMLAFLLPRPSVTAADDVRGLGAVLYCLLTRRWPLSVADAARAGLVAAERTPAGKLRPPSALRPGVPVELDTLCTGALGQGEGIGRVHTAAAMHRMLGDVVATDADQAFFPPVRDGAPAEPDDVWQDFGADTRDDPRRRRNLRIGLSVLAVAVVLVLGWASIQIGSLLGAGGSSGPPVVVPTPAASAPAQPAQPGPAPAQAAGTPVVPSSVEAYDPSGDPDNPGQASRAIDGNPSTAWKTQEYKQQFPALKPGVGLMASFDAAQPINRLTITSSSPGTVVEVRTAPTADAPFEATTPVNRVTLRSGETTVPLDTAQPTQHVLLWITKLGGGGSDNASDISEVTFQRTVQ